MCVCVRASVCEQERLFFIIKIYGVLRELQREA